MFCIPVRMGLVRLTKKPCHFCQFPLLHLLSCPTKTKQKIDGCHLGLLKTWLSRQTPRSDVMCILRGQDGRRNCSESFDQTWCSFLFFVSFDHRCSMLEDLSSDSSFLHTNFCLLAGITQLDPSPVFPVTYWSEALWCSLWPFVVLHCGCEHEARLSFRMNTLPPCVLVGLNWQTQIIMQLPCSSTRLFDITTNRFICPMSHTDCVLGTQSTLCGELSCWWGKFVEYGDRTRLGGYVCQS